MPFQGNPAVIDYQPSGSEFGVVVRIAASGSGTIFQPAQPSSGSLYVYNFSTVPFQLLPSGSRTSFTVYNDSDQTLLVRLGSGVTTSAWTFSLFPQQYYESPYPSYTGVVTAIGFVSGSGKINVQEMT